MNNSQPPKIPDQPLKPLQPIEPNKDSYHLGLTIKGRTTLARERQRGNIHFALGDFLASIDPEIRKSLTVGIPASGKSTWAKG